MNRTMAIIVTIASAVLCGCPGLLLAGTGLLAAFGSQMPEVMAQNPNGTPQDALMGSILFLCVGGILILIPFVAGFVSFRLARQEEPMMNDYIPPA